MVCVKYNKINLYYLIEVLLSSVRYISPKWINIVYLVSNCTCLINLIWSSTLNPIIIREERSFLLLGHHARGTVEGF